MTATLGQFLIGPGEGPTYGVLGHKYRLLVTGQQTDGAYAAIEGVFPRGDGPPPHVHTREDEGLYVVEGTITVMVEGQETEVGPGSFVLVPKGTLHSFRNAASGTARVLITVNPAGLDDFFKAVGIPIADPAADPPPSTVEHLQKVVERAPEYGIEIAPS